MKRVFGKTAATGATLRTRFVVWLIVASLVLVLALAWHALRATSTHLDTASNVLREYATLVAEEYSRRAMGEIGYKGYYTYSNHLRQQLPQATVAAAPAGDDAVRRAASLVEFQFVFDAATGTLETTAAPPLTAALRASLSAHAGGVLSEGGGEFVIAHTELDGVAQTLVMASGPGNARVGGFAVDRRVLGEWLRAAFEQSNLLPQSLGGGAVTNDYVYLRMEDPAGNTLFSSGNGYDPYLRIRKPLADEYSGVFRGHVITAAIDPEIAPQLVIGGLPRSRLPLLAGVFLVTVGLLIAALRQLQREREVLRLRTNFVAEVSHELRTPLTQIRMFAETLLLQRAQSAADQRRALTIIDRESQRLSHLVDNVLRFANGEKRELQVVARRLAPLIQQVVDEFGPLSTQRRAAVVCDLDEAASAPLDADALRQILLNLLDNAVKYGPAEQRIQLTLRQLAGCVQLRVSDAGRGIPAADRERIWSGYHRLQRERDSAMAGTGIGLAVVRELVERHGGRCWVEDAAGGGACFVVELPSAEAGD